MVKKKTCQRFLRKRRQADKKDITNILSFWEQKANAKWQEKLKHYLPAKKVLDQKLGICV